MKRKKTVSFKEFYAKVNAGNGSQQYADTTVTAEGEYASSNGDETTQGSTSVDNIGFSDSGPTFTVEKKEKDRVIDDTISFLEKLNKVGLPTDSEKMDALLGRLQKIADSLFNVGIEPVDIVATIKNPRMAKQYLITGPSAPGGGGKGALQDLKDIKAGLLTDDEDSPGDGTNVNADIEQIDLNTIPAQNDPNSFIDRPESPLEENFMDKKGPGRPGDSKRHGIKKKSSLATLDKIVHSKTASPRKKQLAHWQANMRRGKAKKR